MTQHLHPQHAVRQPGSRRRPTRVGVLAMQGAFREHSAALDRVGASPVEVRDAATLASVDALVVPGGESTTIRKLLVAGGLYDPLREAVAGGLPTLGTCAGLIVLAHADADGAPDCLGLLDVDVERNGFGRQVHSFEATVELAVPGRRRTLDGVFIRAPRISRVGNSVEVIGRLVSGSDRGPAGEPVAVRQGSIVGCTFHPELTTDTSVHELLMAICEGG